MQQVAPRSRRGRRQRTANGSAAAAARAPGGGPGRSAALLGPHCRTESQGAAPGLPSSSGAVPGTCQSSMAGETCVGRTESLCFAPDADPALQGNRTSGDEATGTPRARSFPAPLRPLPLVLLWPHLWPVEVPGGRGSIRSCSCWPPPQPQQHQFRAAAATDRHHGSRQHRILNPLSEARDRTCNLSVPSRVGFRCALTGAPPWASFGSDLGSLLLSGRCYKHGEFSFFAGRFQTDV